ncbi:ATP-dependent Clp protease proteolytic subunit 2 (Endopeptidase Clp 2) [Leadbettera azotonutricia ZAS-9]|uniref:ATP-dependent Clp protease proteolytic subunit n=1 Tax=Leadbettera azotonutricia (strain ATCC BAA-888 / DSM 13862 / ZAS-9) TaxID=545695 RepID=F5YFB6_LEAAZ|nr:ATP-dependent Clp protease proteolytic subunit 2 (Endopeptidase Clp 2) [Leadbettera azotonutricia ZAS-9]
MKDKYSYLALNDDEENEDEEKSSQPAADPLIGRMLKTRTILLAGEINKDLAERIIRQLLLLDDMGEDPIQIFIDSPGGDADAGYAIFDMIRFIKAPVWTIGMGLVASAAAIIELAAPKERRVGLPNSHYLIHQPLSGIRGVATDIEIHARELDKLRDRINHLIADETGVPFGQVEKDTDRDYWMNAAEAVKYGLISKVTASQADLNIPKPGKAGKAEKAEAKKPAAKKAAPVKAQPAKPASAKPAAKKPAPKAPAKKKPGK